MLELVLGVLGMIVVAWFSRQREFRADHGGASLAGKVEHAGRPCAGSAPIAS